MARLYLTQREYDELLQQQNGKCCVEGCGETEGLIGEHSTPEKWRHAKPDQLMCVACHKVKTRRDIKAIWKVKRLNGETLSQHERRRKFGSKLRGRGFLRTTMSLDPVSIVQHLFVLIVIAAFCWVWSRFDRLILASVTVVLFCVGAFGWAVLAFVFWNIAETAHRRWMAEERAANLYNGPWI